MERPLFSPDHDTFRQAFRHFLEREVIPNQEAWRALGQVSRDAWRKAGEHGFLCPALDEKWGGAGADFAYSTIIMEELAYVYESGFAMALHSDIVVPYIESFGSEAQKQRWLPGCASGEL